MTVSTPVKPKVKARLSPTRLTLGQRLRALRLARGLTLQSVAEGAQCSRSFLSMLERGQTDVSATLLQRIAKVFGLSAADILPDEGKAEFLKVVRHQEAPRTLELAKGVEAQLLFGDIAHRIQPVLMTLEAGAAQKNDTGHAGEEFVYVLAGEVRLVVHNAPPRTLRPGDSAYYPSALPHSLSNAGSDTAQVLTLSTPPRLV